MVLEWDLSRKYPIQEDIHEDNILIAFNWG